MDSVLQACKGAKFRGAVSSLVYPCRFIRFLLVDQSSQRSRITLRLGCKRSFVSFNRRERDPDPLNSREICSYAAAAIYHGREISDSRKT